MGGTILRWAGALGALAVLLGAFGAHGLKTWMSTLSDGADRLAWWTTGVRYHMWHALFLLGVAAVVGEGSPTWAKRSLVATVVGVTLFSGSLYLMTLTGWRILGAVTPFGGTALIVAWAMPIFSARRG